jgi:RimJ/RimL family protein N-acetyltransferase
MIPLFQPFPPFVETPRLLLRAPRPGDGLAVNDAVRETFASLHQWMPWAREMPTPEESENFARESAQRYRQGEDFPILLWSRETDELVGASGLHPRDWAVPSFEIGYWLRASCEGKGYMGETVEALTQAAFTHLNAERIIIRCDARNVRSARVAQRAGYTLEATLRRDSRGVDGSLRDTLQFVKLAGE